MPVDKPGVWILSIAIVVIGAILFFAVGGSDRERRERVSALRPGLPAERATQVIGGTPVVCPGVPLDHLARSFPDGWSPAAADVALERLEAETAERWVYALDGEAAPTCEGAGEQTEIGVAADGTILWSVAVLGSSPLVVPPTLTPAGESEAH